MRVPAALSLAVSLLCFSTDLAPQGLAPELVLPGGQTPQAPPAPGGPAVPLPPRDQQRPPAQTGTAVIRGRVVSAETGDPLRRAQIHASAAEVPQGRLTTTDAQGRFELKELPAGRYNISATKGGYISISYGQRRPQEPGRPIQLSNGQVMEKIDFNLPRGSVITGRIVDEFGEAVTGATIQVMRYRFVAGERRLMNVGPFANQTDDRGEFRAFGLAPGHYYITASLRSPIGMAVSDDRTGYAPTYYPGTLSIAEAQLVTVGLAQEVTGLTFALVPSRTGTISGVVLNSEGKLFTRGMVTLRQSFTGVGGGAGFMMGGGGEVRSDGSFMIANVVPGDYTLEVRSNDVGLDSEFASMDLSLAGEDITGLSLVTTKGAAARGQIVFDTDRPPAGIRAADLRLYAQPIRPGGMFGPPQSLVRDDWTFEIKGLSGQRTIFIGNLSSWFVKSIRHDNADITDTPIDFKGADVNDIQIVLTQTVTDFSGGVTDTRGAPVKEYVVVLLAEDRDRWGPRTRFVRTARPDQQGRFRIRGVPPERYAAVALEYFEPGDETNPEVLEQLRSIGTSVVLREGESRALDLTLSAF